MTLALTLTQTLTPTLAEATQPPPAAAASSPVHVGSGSYPADGSAPSAADDRPLSNTPMADAAAASHPLSNTPGDGDDRGAIWARFREL